MPGALIGPFPPGAEAEAYDRMRRRTLWRMPSGLYILGSAYLGRRNLMTHNWAMQVSIDPKLLAVAVRGDSLTHELVDASRAFSLNVLKREDRALARAFTKPAVEGPEPDALSGARVISGSSGAPLLTQAAAWLECQVTAQMATGDHTIFVGEVINCGAPDEEAEVLRMEDTRLNYGG